MSILNHSMPCKAQAAHRLGFIAMRLVPTQEFNAGLPALHYGNGPATHLGSLRSFVFKPANASSIAFWRRNSTSVTATAASSGAHPDKKQVVFLGTPEVRMQFHIGLYIIMMRYCTFSTA